MKPGYFGDFGGRFVSELLIPPLLELEKAMEHFLGDEAFRGELRALLKDYAGRPTPVYLCKRLSERLGFRLWLKREDLLHTGAHKINNALGQALLAKRMGKTEIIAETGAGQHGVAVATVAAALGLRCLVFMGARDMERQKTNVERMRLLGAELVPVISGTQTLKDAINEALRYWIRNQNRAHYCVGSVVGPDPFPRLVKHFQKVIGDELKTQFPEKAPDIIVACVGGGSNAIGIFAPFLKDCRVSLVGVEATGSASLGAGSPGVLHGALTYLLQNREGQVLPSHSVAPGLDYPGVGPEHSYLMRTGRVKYVSVSDEEALGAATTLCRNEGILPALESAHALAYAMGLSGRLSRETDVVVNLSGRGDKDLDTLTRRGEDGLAT